jgi:hypothetical protein
MGCGQQQPFKNFGDEIKVGRLNDSFLKDSYHGWVLEEKGGG